MRREFWAQINDSMIFTISSFHPSSILRLVSSPPSHFSAFTQTAMFGGWDLLFWSLNKWPKVSLSFPENDDHLVLLGLSLLKYLSAPKSGTHIEIGNKTSKGPIVIQESHWIFCCFKSSFTSSKSMTLASTSFEVSSILLAFDMVESISIKTFHPLERHRIF